MDTFNTFGLVKKIGFLIILICLAMGTVACGKKETETKEVETVEEAELGLKNLQEGYYGVYDIMFPVPYGMDSTNSDYDPDEMRYQGYMPKAFRGWLDSEADCELRVGAYDPLKTENMSNEDVAHLFRDIYDIRGMGTDGIVELVNEIYSIYYKDDYYYLKDQQDIELSGLGIEAVRNTVHVDYSNLVEDFIETYFVYKDKLYVVSIERWENSNERIFSDREIEKYENLLQGIEAADTYKDLNDNTDIGEGDEVVYDSDKNIELANNTENWLVAMGYANPKVSIADDSVKVIIDEECSSDQQLEAIEAVVIESTGFSIDNIDIVFTGVAD